MLYDYNDYNLFGQILIIVSLHLKIRLGDYFTSGILYFFIHFITTIRKINAIASSEAFCIAVDQLLLGPSPSCLHHVLPYQVSALIANDR